MSDDTTIFDPNTFLDSVTTEASLRRPPLAAGLELPATITDLTLEQWQSKDGSKSGIKFTVKLDVQVPPAEQQRGQPDKLSMTDTIMLDTKPGGALDYGVGKNNALRRYREATGLNTPGEPFAPRQMIGRQVRVKISHRIYQGDTFDQIDSVAKL